MSKYSEETIQQAEELIEKHAKSSIHTGWHRNWLDDSILKKDSIPAIKAAIVSCEFAQKWSDTGVANYALEQIQNYLKELL